MLSNEWYISLGRMEVSFYRRCEKQERQHWMISSYKNTEDRWNRTKSSYQMSNKRRNSEAMMASFTMCCVCFNQTFCLCILLERKIERPRGIH